MIASNASPWVAPHGATEGRLGTNPICFGFPSADEPVILDIGTSAIIHAEVTLARRLGNDLPENVAFGPEGIPTRDPAAALAGAFATWGGHRGSGLAIVVQLLGILAGSPAIPPELEGFGYLIVTMRPDLMGPAEMFRENVSAFANSVRSARPVAGGAPVRMPFDRSRRERQRQLAADAIEIGFERATTRASDGRQSFVEYCEGAIDIASIRLGLSERDLDDPVVARKVRSAQQFAAAHLLEPVYGGAALGRRHPLEKHPQP